MTVRDSGIPSRSNEAQVIITVIDVNDNSPVFFPNDQYSVDVDEGNYASNSTVIAYVS